MIFVEGFLVSFVFIQILTIEGVSKEIFVLVMFVVKVIQVVIELSVKVPVEVFFAGSESFWSVAAVWEIVIKRCRLVNRFRLECDWYKLAFIVIGILFFVLVVSVMIYRYVNYFEFVAIGLTSMMGWRLKKLFKGNQRCQNERDLA